MPQLKFPSRSNEFWYFSCDAIFDVKLGIVLNFLYIIPDHPGVDGSLFMWNVFTSLYKNWSL